MSSMGRFVAFLCQCSSGTTAQMRDWVAFWSSLAWWDGNPGMDYDITPKRVRPPPVSGARRRPFGWYKYYNHGVSKFWRFCAPFLELSAFLFKLLLQLISCFPTSPRPCGRDLNAPPGDGVNSGSILGWRQACSTGVFTSFHKHSSIYRWL